MVKTGAGTEMVGKTGLKMLMNETGVDEKRITDLLHFLKFCLWENV